MDEATAHAILAQLYPNSRATTIVPFAGSDSNATHLIKAQASDGVEIALVVHRYKIFYHYDRGEKARREYRLFELLYHSEVPVPEPKVVVSLPSVEKVVSRLPSPL